jgi:NADPH:quinone reductase
MTAHSIPATMRAVIVTTPGGPDMLEVVQRPVPRPAHGEVLIKVAAAGVNGADLSQRLGRYPMPKGTPDIFGLEASGTVVAVGDGVDVWKAGDEVCAILIGGGYAEYCAVPAVQCLPVPKGVTLQQAGALPEVVLTVWSNVFEIGALAPGDRLLVHGGASGIGTTAIQLGRALGAIVYATAGSDEKCRVCERLGATKAFNYKTQDFVAEIQKGPGAVDVVLDMVGGDYVGKNMTVLAPQGRLVMLAFKNGSKVELDCGMIQAKNLTFTGSRLRPRPVAEKGRLCDAVRKAVWPLIADGRVKPVIDSTFPLTEAGRAHARMEAGLHTGKVLLTV